jgi:hypothetical protein
MSKNLSITFYLITLCTVIGKPANPLLESTLLISLGNPKIDNTSLSANRRSFQEFSDDNFEENKNAFEIDPTLSKLPSSIVSTFESSRDDSIPTSKSLDDNLKKLFESSDDVKTDFEDALDYLTTNKNGLGLSDAVLLSALKSVYKSSISQPQSEITSTAPMTMLMDVLPKVKDWGGTGPTWIKRLAQITTESLMEIGSTPEIIHQNATSFSEAIVEVSTNPQPLKVPGMLGEFEGVDEKRTVPNDKMNYGGLSGFDPSNFTAYQQLAVGLTQGFLNSKLSLGDSNSLDDRGNSITQLSIQDLKDLSNYEQSLIKSTTDGLLSGISKINERNPQISLNESSLYAYDSLKSMANGFVLSSTVYATSEPEYLANGLYMDAAELISRGVAHSAVSHDISKSAGLSVGRIAESVSHGSAMGAQLATVLPKSMEYVKNWEIFSQSRRDIAQAVARGSSFGSVDAASIHFSDSPKVIDQISKGASLGSMMGTTGLAIYYPTDQLVPIINFTAQGSAYGSVNSKNLKNIDKEATATEQIHSSLARQSALGSSMGAIFEPTVLLGLSPATKSDDKQTIDNLSAAAFGATFGAIQGSQEKDITDTETGNALDSVNESLELVEITQSVKQGSIEGALAGAKLALGIESTSNEDFNSKGSIMKAVNSSNAKAASEANSPVNGFAQQSNNSKLVGNPMKTSSKDMLLLMKKFGINPRYTNAATMFKRPVTRPIDEAPENLLSETDPSTDNNQTYSESISNASPI